MSAVGNLILWFSFCSGVLYLAICHMATDIWALGRYLFVLLCCCPTSGTHLGLRDDHWLCSSHCISAFSTSGICYFLTVILVRGRCISIWCCGLEAVATDTRLRWENWLCWFHFIKKCCSFESIVGLVKFELYSNANLFVFWYCVVSHMGQHDNPWSCKSNSSLACYVFGICHVLTDPQILWIFLSFPEHYMLYNMDISFDYCKVLNCSSRIYLLAYEEAASNDKRSDIFIFHGFVLHSYITLWFWKRISNNLFTIDGFAVLCRTFLIIVEAWSICNIGSITHVRTKIGS